MNANTALMQLGLSQKEIAVYFSALELGMAPISVIARKARLKRSTVSEILQRLSEKGLAEFFVRKKTRFYSVVPPKLLLERYKSSVDQLEASLPEMLEI